MADFVTNPDGDQRIGDHLRTGLAARSWTHLSGAVAFVRASGVRHLADGLRAFCVRGGVVRLAVGVDLQGSSEEGLRMLLDCVQTDAQVCVFHNETDSTFHPKLWLFEDAERAELIVGSGNLTGGGLYTNYEAALRIVLDKASRTDAATISSAREIVTQWTTPDDRLVKMLTFDLLDELVVRGYVLPEVTLREIQQQQRGTQRAGVDRPPRLFAAVRVPAPPASGRSAAIPERHPRRREEGGAPALVSQRGFVMTLQTTDVGVGQTSRGTSRRSPEIFIPLAARDHEPTFWGWTEKFTEDPRTPGKRDRVAVPVRLGAETIEVSMMTWPLKHDFRLRSEALRSAGDVGDILRLEKVEGNASFEYYAEIIPRGTTLFDEFSALCIHPVRNSQKRWGYYASPPSEA